MNAIAIYQRNDDLAVFSNPAGYVEYETRTTLRDLIEIYGLEGAKLRVLEMFSDEERRRAR